MRNYKCLNQNKYQINEFSLVPLRDEDKLLIMKWRNEQIYHLRQAKPLTIQDQELYYKNVIAKLFEEAQPNQILFSFLENDDCVGYGGLVHINWTERKAEFSFLINTANEKEFESVYWSVFLKLLDKVAFEDLEFNKIYGYAYDVRPHLYAYLLENNYTLEARLKDHYLLDNKYYDVVIHSKLRNNT